MSSVNVLKDLWLNHPTYGLPTLSRQINIRGFSIYLLGGGAYDG